jgi:hypothetical protein
VVVRRCLVKRSAQDDDVTYSMDFGTGNGLVEDCVFLNSNGSGFKTTERTGDATFRRVRCEGNRLMGFQQTGDSGSGSATFEDVVCRDNGAPAFRLSGPFDYHVPSDARIVGANNKVGIRGAGGHLEADGDVDLAGNSNNAIYNGETTGYIEQLHTTGSVTSGDITIRSRDDQPVTDIDGVPTADEVGAFTSTQTAEDPQETYRTEFGEDPLGEQPADWAREWATASGEFTVSADGPGDGECLELAADAGARRALRWTAPGDVSDIEMHALVSLPEIDSDTDDYCRLYARSGGAAGDETAYFFTLRDDAFALRAYTDGGIEQLWTGDTPVAGQPYLVRFRVEGTELKLRVWEADTDEPAGWDATVSDSTLSAGWAGVGAYSHATQYWGAVTAGTGGLNAPAIEWSEETDDVDGTIRAVDGLIQSSNGIVETL